MISLKGLGFVKDWEQFRARPYNDGFGFMTVGYGHLIKKGERFGVISEDEALGILMADVSIAEEVLNRRIAKGVKLTQQQRDALISFVYNVGETNFATSTMLKKLNVKNFDGASMEFEKWIYSKGKIAPGNVIRRRQEKDIFVRGIYDSRH